MIVVGSERGVAFGTLSVPRLVARLQAVEAEHVEALGEDRVLLVGFASGAGQLLLVVLDFREEHLIGVVRLFDFAQSLVFPTQGDQFFLQPESKTKLLLPNCEYARVTRK